MSKLVLDFFVDVGIVFERSCVLSVYIGAAIAALQ